jgi:hypothetical protein
MERRLRARARLRNLPRFAIAPKTYSFAWRLCVDTVGAGATGVGVNTFGPPGLMLFSVEDTGGVVVVLVVVVGVVVVEGFSFPLSPQPAVSPPIAIRAPVPTTAARQQTLRDLIVFPNLFPIYSRSIPDLFPIYSRSIPDLFPIYSRSIPDLFPIYPRPAGLRRACRCVACRCP